jgi:hypothetical protein
LNAPASMAMPTIGNTFSGVIERPTEAQLYCYNRWGPCWHRPYYPYGWHGPYSYYGWHRPYYHYGWHGTPYLPYYSARKRYWYKGR